MAKQIVLMTPVFYEVLLEASLIDKEEGKTPTGLFLGRQVIVPPTKHMPSSVDMIIVDADKRFDYCSWKSYLEEGNE